MNLAILVVFMVSEENEKLLELHLARIEQHTTGPYTIYGSSNRLLPQFIQRLRQNIRIKLYELPPTDMRGSDEHSYYLEQLLERAIDDGASHVAILHVDSFPIRDGWVEELSAKLSPSCAFATTDTINTGCLLFQRDFYLNYRPTLLLSAEERESVDYKKYCRAVEQPVHSGIGYGFRAYQNGLSWYNMCASFDPATPDGPAIYDDLLFHLRGAMRLSNARSRRPPLLVRWLGHSRFERLLRIIRARTPEQIRLFVQSNFRPGVRFLVDQPRIEWQSKTLVSAQDQLFQDPVSYIDQLRGRTGANTESASRRKRTL
jgi:hypothetical protein